MLKKANAHFQHQKESQHFFYFSSCLKVLVIIMRPNFTIVDGEDNFEELYEKFEKDYIHSDLYIPQILEKYGISQWMYLKLRKEVTKRTGYKRPRRTNYSLPSNEERYIYPTPSGRYVIRKTINHKNHYFGTYSTFEDACKVRSIFEENGWDKSILPQIKEKYSKKSTFEDSFEHYDDFARDYMNYMKCSELMEKYDLSCHKYNKLSSKVKKEYNLDSKPKEKAYENC